MIKKIIVAFGVISMCVMLFACTQGDVNEPTTVTTTNETILPETSPDEADTSEMTTEKETGIAATTHAETTAETQEPTETGAVELYQLVPETRSLMQSYVIKTPNGKLIVIDGGIDGEGRDRSPYLPTALRAIAGVGQNDYFEVEAWFLSHAHKDHMYELSKMLSEYGEDSNYKINNIYFDFPEFGSESYPTENADMEFSKIRENINKYGEVIGAQVQEGSTYYDDLNGAVINSESVSKGLSLEIDSVRFDILQTWSPEDGYSNINDTSLVIRMVASGQSVLFLNDLGSNGGARLLRTYGEALKSDIVQMAHHGQAGVNKDVYDAIDAKVHLWPTPIWVWKNADGIYQIDEVRTWLYGKTFLEADEYNIVSCLYDSYPTNATRVNSWNRVLDNMKIELPYTVPDRPEDETVIPIE